MTRTSGRRSMALVGVALATPLLLGGCSKSDDTATTGPSTTAPAGSVVNVNQGPTIEIDRRAFAPEDATAKVNQIVTWTNLEEGIAHTITEDKPEAERVIKSTPVNTGESYTLTFDKAGTYSYICSIHPSTMKGSIVITE